MVQLDQPDHLAILVHRDHKGLGDHRDLQDKMGTWVNVSLRAHQEIKGNVVMTVHMAQMVSPVWPVLMETLVPLAPKVIL